MNLTVSSAPHIRGEENTRRIMLDVLIALVPALNRCGNPLRAEGAGTHCRVRGGLRDL